MGAEVHTPWIRRLITIAITVIVCGVASLMLWDPLDIDERLHVRRITEESARSVRADIDGDLRAGFLAQIGLAKLVPAEVSSKRERELSSKLFLDHHPGYVAVEWVDSTATVHWLILSDEKYRNELSRINAEHVRSIVARALVGTRKDVTISQTFPLIDGRAAALVSTPVYKDGAMIGCLLALVDINTVLGSILQDHSGLGYSVSVSEGASEIYRTAGTTREYEAEWAQPATLDLPGVTWNIQVWPNPNMLADIRSVLPEVALGLGCLLGLLLMLTMHFARDARQKSRALGKAHDELEARVRDRTAELEHANKELQGEITERMRAEESLKDLSARLLQLQDEERRRIARDLHDSTAQLLTAVSVNLAKIESFERGGGHNLVLTSLQESKEFIERVTVEIRTMSYLLHPPMLEDFGLEYAVPWYAEGFAKRSGIAVQLDIQAELGRLPREIELTLFRITQEALANVHHHSQSPSARITLKRDQRFVTLEIADQGRGIPKAVLESAQNLAAELGVGIAGMRERVRQLKGSLEFQCGSQGTTVCTVLPLEHGRRSHALYVVEASEGSSQVEGRAMKFGPPKVGRKSAA